MKSSHALFFLTLLMGLSACGSTPPRQQADTVPLRSGQQIATEVGAKTREVQAKNKDLVLYATSIEEKPEAPSEQASGSVTVYSKPRGEIVLDGTQTGVQTPDTVNAEQGRHEVQVIFEGGETSEIKVVRIRKDSRVKLFFRLGDPDSPEPKEDTTSAEPEGTP